MSSLKLILMPWAKIIYDRYNMQAQFGKDVLEVMRLKHNATAKQKKENRCPKAEIKEKIVDGLIVHSYHTISTGKIEGFNNRIKVTKENCTWVQ